MTKQRPVLKLKTATPAPAAPARPAGPVKVGQKPAPRGRSGAYAARQDAKSQPARPEQGAEARPSPYKGAPAREGRPFNAERRQDGEAAPARAPYKGAPSSAPDRAGQAGAPYKAAGAPGQSRSGPARAPFKDDHARAQDRAGPSRALPYKPSPVREEAPQDAGPRPSYLRAFKPALQTGFKNDLKPDSLAFSLLGAATAVAQVRAGSALPQALAAVAGAQDATPQARGAMQDIAYRAMRKLGWTDALVAQMAPKAPEPLVAALLSCALPLMMTQDDGQALYNQFTVVDQTVTAAGAHPDTARAKAMVNALLRRFQRERKELLEAIAELPEAKWNYPQWWIDSVITAYPKDWQAILENGNQPPPLTLRVNARRATVDEYLQTLEQAGIAAQRIGEHAVRLAKPVGVHAIPGFAEGLVSVQDAAAQLAAPLLDVQDGMRVLDACAAPGGKTCHLLELAEVQVTALDADAKRLQRVGENLQRLGLQASLQAAEAQASGWWDGQPFDRILADVPCTASGIVRRHPDIRWLRRKGDALQLATLSSQILDNLWQMLAPNGKLLFVTCSLWPQESEAQAAAFAVRHGATRLAAPGQLLPTGSSDQDHDGLFYALFQKQA